MNDTSPTFPAADSAAEPLPDYAFTPVATRSSRHYDWAAERQRRFIAAMGSMVRAATNVGTWIGSA